MRGVLLLTLSLSKVESSEWLQLLQTVMQLAGAVTDLMDLQVGMGNEDYWWLLH